MGAKGLPKGITQRPDGRYMARFQYKGEKYCLYDYNIERLQERMSASRQPVARRSSASDNFSSKQLKNPETMRFSGFFLFRLFALFWHSLTRFEPFFMG